MKIQFLDGPQFLEMEPQPPLVYCHQPLTFPNVLVLDDVTRSIQEAYNQTAVRPAYFELVLTPEEYAMLTTSPEITERVRRQLVRGAMSTDLWDLWKSSNETFRRALDADPFKRHLQVQACFILQQFFDVAAVRIHL